MRVKIDAECNTLKCWLSSDDTEGNALAGNSNDWCEILVSQHIPQGAYIDVDEVKVRYRRKLLLQYLFNGTIDSTV